MWGKVKFAHGVRNSMRNMSEARACLPKIKHATWTSAERACLQTIEQDLERGRPAGHLGVYRCTYCRFWHVGHGRGPDQQAGRKLNAGKLLPRKRPG